jgi:hypothetical protein
MPMSEKEKSFGRVKWRYTYTGAPHQIIVT